MATRTLAHTMEFCGAYHFGQWVHIFSEQPHYESPKSDLQQTASQDEFGHPYVFIGIPGIGTGHGWESILYNTGHYIPTDSVNVPKAFIRGIMYYDYVARMFRIRTSVVNTAELFRENRPPLSETIHNPTPASKVHRDLTSTMLPRAYKPYVGTLQRHITSLIEANETVPPFNYAFLLYTIAGVMRVDPRPRARWLTEYERVWSGSSARFWAHNGTLLHKGLMLHERNCTSYLNWGYSEASPEKCGEDFTCNDLAPLNDFSTKQKMIDAGWKFSWNNALTFKPDKQRYDITRQVPWSSYWGLNTPFHGEVEVTLRGKGSMSISFGNCWQYALGRVELLYNGVVVMTANAMEINKVFATDFKHLDHILIRESEAVIVLNWVDMNCWGCCQTVDYPNVIATKCNVGVTPTLCRNLEKFQIQNLSTFRVIDTAPEQLSIGLR